MPEVVCNTSPPQYLHQIGALDVLRLLYGKILAPGAVAAEIETGIQAGVSLPVLEDLPWAKIREVPAPSWPIPRDIHRGEAEVIALARSIEDTSVILDDLAAKRHAKLLGLRTTGTLGVLLKAKQSGILTELAPVVEHLTDAGFRLADSTREEFMKLAGE